MPWPKPVKKVLRPIATGLGLRPGLKTYDDREFLNYVERKRSGLLANRNNIETLVIGSSHADYGFDPAGFAGSFNSSLISCDLYTSYMIAKEFSDRLSNLSRIIIFYSVFSPGFNLIKTRERYRAISYQYFLNAPLQSASFVNPILEKQILQKCESLHSAGPLDGYLGFERNRRYMHAASGRQRALSHLRENQREPTEFVWLKKLVDLAADRGLDAFVVVPPFRSDYVASLPGKEYLLRHLDLLGMDRVQTIDFFGSPIFDDSDMGDPDHLSSSGALKLARHLRELVV